MVDSFSIELRLTGHITITKSLLISTWYLHAHVIKYQKGFEKDTGGIQWPVFRKGQTHYFEDYPARYWNGIKSHASLTVQRGQFFGQFFKKIHPAE